jgi:hypothetical protein
MLAFDPAFDDLDKEFLSTKGVNVEVSPPNTHPAQTQGVKRGITYEEKDIRNQGL